MQPRTEHDRRCQRGRAAVAVRRRGKRRSAQAVMANPAVTEEGPAGTAQMSLCTVADDRYRGIATDGYEPHPGLS